MTDQETPGTEASEPVAAASRFAFIEASWHADLVDRCRAGFLEGMAEGGVSEDSIEIFEVPGSFEIPLVAARLARSGRFTAIVAAGLVVDGGVYRHDFVAGAVIDALMRVQLDTWVPVISAVLTPHHFHEHATHSEFFHDQLHVKGGEAAAACLATIRLHGRMTEQL